MDDILQDRKKTHGDYDLAAITEQRLKEVLHAAHNWPLLSDAQKTTLEMLAHKQARILTGDHNHPDHWFDLMGYSQRGLESTQRLNAKGQK